MQNQCEVVNKHPQKGSAAIWVFSIIVTLLLMGLQIFGAFRAFSIGTAFMVTACAAAAATLCIWLTSYHDEPDEPFTKVTWGIKIALWVLMGISAGVLFYFGRSMDASRSYVASAGAAVEAQRKALQATIDNPKTGPKARFKATEALGKLDTSYAEDEKKTFLENEPIATFAMGLDLAGVIIGAMLFMFMLVFKPTGKMVAARNGVDPRTVVSNLDERKLQEIRTRVGKAEVQTQSPSPAGGEMKDGMHWAQVEKELDAAHPNVSKGSRTEIDGTLYEFNGQNWQAQGVYGAGGGDGAQSPAPSQSKVTARPAKAAFQIQKPNVRAGSDDSLSRQSRDTVATQKRESRDSVATQSGIEKIREALRTGYAKPGHFFFKAEDKTGSRRNPGVLVRMMSYRQNGQEFELASHLFDVELMAFAENNEVYLIGEYMESEMFENFDLGAEVK